MMLWCFWAIGWMKAGKTLRKPYRIIIDFYPKNNRLAPQIYAVNPDGSGGQWIKNDEMNDEYFGSLDDIYADTNPLYVPTGKILIGFKFLAAFTSLSFL